MRNRTQATNSRAEESGAEESVMITIISPIPDLHYGTMLIPIIVLLALLLLLGGLGLVFHVFLVILVIAAIIWALGFVFGSGRWYRW